MAAAAPPPRRRPPLLLLLPLVLLLVLPAALANTNAALLDANKLHDDESVVTLQAEAVAGGVAKLACDMTPPIIGDKASLVIWFKEGIPKPIYSYDARGSGGQAKHWADDTFGGRAFFRVTDNPAQLTVESARDGDGGMYRCRVDFGRSPTRNARVNLTVILPPEQLLIMDNRGEHIRHFMLGPYNEGDSVDITCEASGGRPLPRVTWWYENIMLDDSYERRSERRVQNVLHLENLQRKELNRVYTCKASNNQLAAPITSFVRLDMNLRPLSVTLLGDNRPFSAEKTYEVSCEVLGARPVPQITWWKGNTQLQNAKEVTSQDQNSTISTLLFTPVVEDSGLALSCRAENPRLPNSVLVDSWTLDIYHVPVVTLQLGRPLNASALTEGVDVFFECHIKANPRIHRVGWRHDRTPLIQNASAGTIISNQSLVLQSVSRARAGMYTCVAVNQEGDGESNPVQLDVKYRPLCRAGQQHTWGVGRGETIEIPCDVDANPDDVQFTWRLNTTSDSIEIPPSRHRADRARSYLSHTPQSERDYGTLLCWGTNALGTQKQPCTFHVIPAGKPNSPINCSLANQTTESLTVTCSEGFDGGVPKQQFLLELYNEQTHLLVSNVTNHVPVFTVGGLESGLDFRADLFAYNLKGRSEPVRMHAYTLKGAERRLAATQAALQITPLVGLLVGVVASLVLAAVLIVVVLRMRGRGEGHDEKSEDRRDKAATISASAGGKGDGKGEPEQCQGQGLGLADENNPDLIPDKSADEFVDPEEKAFEYLNDRRLYSTLNPRLGLYSPSSIDHIGPNMPNGPKMDGEVTYAELSLQRPMGDPCIQRSMAPSPQPLSLGPMGGLGGPLSGPLSPMYGPGAGGPGGPGRGLLHAGPYGGPGSAMTLPHPGQRGGLVSCLRRPPGPGGPPLGPAHEPTMYAQIAVCRGSLVHGPGLGQGGLGLGPGRGRGDSLVEDVAGEAVEAPPMEHRDTSISSLQPLLDTRCNTIGGHGKGVGLLGKPPAAVTATRF